MLSEIEVGQVFWYGLSKTAVMVIGHEYYFGDWNKTHGIDLKTGVQLTWSRFVGLDAPPFEPLDFKIELGKHLGIRRIQVLPLGTCIEGKYLKIGEDRVLNLKTGRTSKIDPSRMVDCYDSKIAIT